jgi:hypothetical protein
MNIDLKLKMNNYLRTIGKTTPEERGKLRSWMKVSGTAYSNPWDFYEERGTLMDYITALRVAKEMDENPSAFISEFDPQQSVDDDEDIPF